MYFHLFVSILSWIIGLCWPSPQDKYMVTFMALGFIAFLLFLKDFFENGNKHFLQQAEEAEGENHKDLSSFKGRFVMIRDEDFPISKGFSYIIFNNGEIEVPLFCRNSQVIQKAAKANSELIIYYKNYILVDVEELD